MKNKKIKLDKQSGIIIFIFTAYLIVMLAIFLPGYLYKKGTLYIVTSSIKIKYKDGNWSNIEDLSEYKNKKFNIYDDNKYIGDYKILYVNDTNIYYGEDDEINHSNKIFAYGGSKKMEILKTNHTDKISDIDKEIINKALAKADINYSGDFEMFSRIDIDTDNDGIDEYIYFISNYYQSSENEKIYMMFMYKNNEIYIIEKVKTDEKGIYDYPIFYPYKVIDFRKDGNLELLYVGNYPNGANDNNCAKLYDLNRNKEIHDFCK